jgi:hypothetical protein
MVWFGWLMVFNPTIFQLYRGGQFYWWRKPECPEKTTDLSKTLSHNVVSCTPRHEPNFILVKPQVPQIWEYCIVSQSNVIIVAVTILYILDRRVCDRMVVGLFTTTCAMTRVFPCTSFTEIKLNSKIKLNSNILTDRKLENYKRKEKLANILLQGLKIIASKKDKFSIS